MTEPSNVQRFWIPATFHFTRLSEESVEAVLASDYDVLRTENERLTYRQQVIADTVGEENWSLRKQLADAQARVKEESAIVDRVWKALGITTYEQAGGQSIDEIVSTLTARLAQLEADLETQRTATYQAVEREHAAKKRITQVEEALENEWW